MNEHIAGEWEVIRTKSNITVAQGYKCSCGVIDCPHMQLSVPASPAIAPSSAEPTVPELRKAFIAGWNAHADDGGPKLTELFQLAEPPPSSTEPQAEVAGAPPAEGQERELALFKQKARDWNAEADRYLAAARRAAGCAENLRRLVRIVPRRRLSAYAHDYGDSPMPYDIGLVKTLRKAAALLRSTGSRDGI